MENIKRWLDVLDANRDDMALGFMSPPGFGKTTMINEWAREHGRNVVEIVLSQRMPSEISGMPMPVSEERRMDVFDYDALLSLKEGDILFLDEFTNGNIQTLNACLTLIQDRTMLSGRKLSSIMVVAAGNPTGACDLLPQTKQRFVWIDVRFSPNMWRRYISKKYGFSPNREMISAIEEYLRNQKDWISRGVYNFITPRTAENIIRIARSIDKDDKLWKTLANGDWKFVASVYDAMANVNNDLNKMKDVLRNHMLRLYRDTGNPGYDLFADLITDVIDEGELKIVFGFAERLVNVPEDELPDVENMLFNIEGVFVTMDENLKEAIQKVQILSSDMKAAAKELVDYAKSVSI